MRKLILAGWIGLLLTGSLAAQPGGEPWANKLFSAGTSKDFGTVAKGAQLKHTFKVTNIYKVPLEITKVQPGCGCVSVTDPAGVDMVLDLRKAVRVIEPSESIYLHINMDSRRFDGPKTVTISVTVGPHYISTAVLNVQATTRRDVVLNPGYLDFGVVHRGSTPTLYFDVEYAGAGAWRLDEIFKNSNAPFNLRPEDLKVRLGAGKTGYRIYVTLKPDAPAGQFKEEILLKTNDAVLPFHISGNVQAPLTVSPPSIVLSAAKEKEKRVTVFGSRPFRISKIDGQGQGITAEFASDKLAPAHVIIIRCQPDTPADLRKVLTIYSSLDGESVPLTVEIHSEK